MQGFGDSMSFDDILKSLTDSDDPMDHLGPIYQLKEKLSLSMEDQMQSFQLQEYTKRLIQILGMPIFNDIQMDIKCKLHHPLAIAIVIRLNFLSACSFPASLGY